MVLGMSEIPAVLVQNSKTVMRQTVSHELSVQVAIPFDGDGNHTALNGHSVKKIQNYIPYFRKNLRPVYAKSPKRTIVGRIKTRLSNAGRNSKEIPYLS